MSRKGTYIGIAVGLSILAIMLWSYLGRDALPLFYVSPGAVPAPVRVTITRSNGPVRAFFGPLHAMLILPDGSLWEWGGLGGFSGKKIRVPTKVGTNDDWVGAAVADGHYLGIREDGTLWNWGTPYSLSPLAVFQDR